MTGAPRAWQRMLSGRRLDLLNPTPLDIEITDIAHGLSRVARWNGQTTGAWAFSVAQHSLLVEALFRRDGGRAEAQWRLAALLHDASEYVIGDMISPFKSAIGRDYRKIEDALQAAVHLRFSLPARLPDDIARRIKRADRRAAFIEAVGIAGFTPGEARKLWPAPKPSIAADSGGEGSAFDTAPLPPDQAKARFMRLFGELCPPP